MASTGGRITFTWAARSNPLKPREGEAPRCHGATVWTSKPGPLDHPGQSLADLIVIVDIEHSEAAHGARVAQAMPWLRRANNSDLQITNLRATQWRREDLPRPVTRHYGASGLLGKSWGRILDASSKYLI
jgi:hypothetical protein